jgi:hypothetical protein
MGGHNVLTGIALRIAVTKQAFWGGNILVGDLNMVSDFIETLREIFDATDYCLELVLIPSSFAKQWGFDLQGGPFAKSRRQLAFQLNAS